MRTVPSVAKGGTATTAIATDELARMALRLRPMTTETAPATGATASTRANPDRDKLLAQLHAP